MVDGEGAFRNHPVTEIAWRLSEERAVDIEAITSGNIDGHVISGGMFLTLVTRL